MTSEAVAQPRTEYEAWREFLRRQDDPDAIDEARAMGHVAKRDAQEGD